MASLWEALRSPPLDLPGPPRQVDRVAGCILFAAYGPSAAWLPLAASLLAGALASCSLCRCPGYYYLAFLAS